MRCIRMIRLALLVVLLAFGIVGGDYLNNDGLMEQDNGVETLGTVTEDDVDGAYGFIDPEKVEPEKADPSCKTLEERLDAIRDGDVTSAFLPCREEDSSDESSDADTEAELVPPVDTANPLLTNSSEGSASTYASSSRATSNRVRFNVYVAVPPYTPSLGRTLKVVVTMYLNVTSLNCSFRLRSWQEEEFVRTDGSDALGVAISMISGAKKKITTDMYLVDADPELYSRTTDAWWWKYRFWFDGYVPDSGEPMLNATMLYAIKWASVRTLKAGVSLLDEGLLKQFGLESLGEELESVIRIQFEKPSDGKREPELGSTPAPTSYPSGDSVAQKTLDISYWGWRRYCGLGVLLGIISTTLCLTLLAHFRQRKRMTTERWSNLTTEQGVEELLRNGWALRGDKMEVYDKRNVGYRDDDSVFVGGYEQKEFVGAEITVTAHPSSQTTRPWSETTRPSSETTRPSSETTPRPSSETTPDMANVL
jgi:hypothetical protein